MPPSNGVENKLNWNETISTRTRLALAITGFVLLIAGVICQWYATNNINDASLKDFCETYSGYPDLNRLDEWYTAKQDYYKKYGDTKGPMDLKFVASQFLGFLPDGDYPLNGFLGTSPSFWCKYLPKCPDGVECDAGKVVQSKNWTTGAWEGRPVSDKASWAIREGSRFTDDRIRCVDKRDVYFDMVSTIFTNLNGEWQVDPETSAVWTEEKARRAAQELLINCLTKKGPNGFFLGLGPFLSSVSVLTCFFTMFKFCSSPFMLSSGKAVMLVAIAITLVDFWVISYMTNGELVQGYQFCGEQGAPLVTDRKYVDGTTCVDVNSLDENLMNPFIAWSGWMSGTYTAGGILNLFAIFLTLIAISKAEESNTVRKFQNLGPSDEM